MKKNASQIQFALVAACFWVAATARISGAVHEYVISYTDLTPPPAFGGLLKFTSGDQQGGQVDAFATIWNGPLHSLVNLHPASATSSKILGGVGTQQVGYTAFGSFSGTRAALWNGSVASYVNLNPSWSSHSMAFATTGTQQAGFVTQNFQVRAGLWSGTAESFVDLHPEAGVSSTAYAIAGNQQGGFVNFNGFGRAALWSGTAASYRNLRPAALFERSTILGMTTNQQVGYAGEHAGIWFGAAGSFLNLHPAGAGFSEAHATIDTMQVGFATFDSLRHAILWFGSADNYLDLQPALGSHYIDSEAYSVWTDGSTILVAGMARDRVAGIAHPLLWSLTDPPSSINCSAPLILECTNGAAMGALQAEVQDLSGSTVQVVWTVNGTPTQTNTIPSGSNITHSNLTFRANFGSGEHVVVVTASNSGTNSATCSMIVSVRDRIAPALVCPTNLTVPMTGATGALVSLPVEAIDGCAGEVEVICTPRSGSVFPIGTTHVTCVATDGSGNSTTCSFEVTVLGPLSIKLAVLQEMEAAEAAKGGKPLPALHRAIIRLRRAVAAELWVDETHLKKIGGRRVFENEAATVRHLRSLLRISRDQIPDAVVQSWISRLVTVDRTLAVLQIDEASAAGAGPKQIALASRRLARGDRTGNRPRPAQAILLYRQAWRAAAHNKE